MTHEITELQKKAEVFYTNKVPVHVTFKTHSWMNGLITSVEADFFLLNEYKLGSRIIFFSEVLTLSEYVFKTANEVKE